MIKKLLGRLLGTDEALTEVVKGARDGIDALIYTDEEKANDAAKDRAEARQMIVEWMSATQGQNLARRLIALSITGVWLSMYLLSVFCSMIALFANNAGTLTADKINQIGTIASGSAADMNPAVMLILTFYFAAPHMGDIAKAVQGRFKRSINKG